VWGSVVTNQTKLSTCRRTSTVDGNECDVSETGAGELSARCSWCGSSSSGIQFSRSQKRTFVFRKKKLHFMSGKFELV
jgi:hypothetical protein